MSRSADRGAAGLTDPRPGVDGATAAAAVAAAGGRDALLDRHPRAAAVAGHRPGPGERGGAHADHPRAAAEGEHRERAVAVLAAEVVLGVGEPDEPDHDAR